MISPVLYSVGFAALMAGLLVEVTVFRAIHDDPPSIYKLFSLRDRLVRLVLDGEIERHEPHFEAIYCNVNILLSGCRRLSGPDGWKVAEADGRHLAHHPSDHIKLVPLPQNALPGVLEPVVIELCGALEHIVGHHFGLNLVMSERRREQSKVRRARAEALLKIMTCGA